MAEPARHHTVKSLAAASAVSTTMIYQLIERRQLGHLRIGSAIRIRREDVEAYEAEHRLAAADTAAPYTAPIRGD